MGGFSFNPASGALTDEARVAMAQADAENRQALRDAGVNVEGMSPEQYQATIQAFGEWSNLPENRAYRNQRSAIGNFVDSIGGPAGLFLLTAGATFLAGGGLGAMGGAPAASTAAAPSVTAPTAAAAAPAAGAATVPTTAGGFFSPTGAGSALAGGTASGGAATGIPNVGLVAGGGAGAAGGGSAFNLAAGTGLSGTAAAGGGINLAATGMPAFTQGAAATGAGTLGGIGTAIAAPSAPLTMSGLVGGASPAAGGMNLAAGGGAASTAAGTINLGAGQAGGVLGGGAGAVSTSAPLTMGGLLGGTSPAAGAINLGAAGLGTAAGGAGMGGFNLGQFFNQAGNFLSSPGGQLLTGLGEVGLGYLGQQDRMDLARELAQQGQFRPYNIQGPLGAVSIEGQNINIAPTAQQQAFQESLFGLGAGAFGRAADPTLQNIFAQTPAQLQQLTQQFIGQETALPGQAATLEQRLMGLGGEALGTGRSLLGGVSGVPSAAGAITPFLRGPAPTTPGEALTSQAARSSLGMLAEGAGGARDITGVLAGAGGELLRGAAAEQPSFNQMATERLAALRAAARPEEERTTQAALERLFGQGRLGTTGGAQVLGELSRAQELADIQRITSAQDFAQTQQNVALENALRRGQLGISALEQARGGTQYLGELGTSLLGLGAETGLRGRTLEEQARSNTLNAILGGVGTDIEAALGAGRIGTELFGLGAGMPATVFEAQRFADTAALNRGAQRVLAAEGLFGFGQQARGEELGMGLDIMAGLRGQYDPLIQLTNIASGMGSAQSLAALRGGQDVLGSYASPYLAGSGLFGRAASIFGG